MNSGSTAFMIIATALVMIMTPGLAFFYGGLSGKKNLVGIMFQSFVALGVTSIMWFICGYSLCFSGSMADHTDMLGGIIGNFKQCFLFGITPSTPYGDIPMFVFIAYQLMFAIITPALITGAFKKRVTFKAYLIFLVIWQILVYYPFAHMIWGGGLMATMGVRDFAGGIVVHATAGFGALASVFYVGKRINTTTTANSIPLIAIGTGLLWFGWFGFNAGSELRVDSVTGLAFMNTNMAAAVAGMTWLFIDWYREKKPKFVAFMTGAVAGLATITPASGYVTIKGAFAIGIAAGVVCYLAVMLKNHKKWDDALDVWGVHGVGGAIGTILLGVFGCHAMNGAIDKMVNNVPVVTNGIYYAPHSSSFFMTQLLAVLITCVYSFIVTYGILFLINLVVRVRATPAEEEAGLDESLHGEKAYDEGAY